MEDRLQKFARLVDVGSFTKAAQALHISQPALTTAIQKLERELKSELIVRRGHTFTITTAGQSAYDTAKAMAVQTDNLKLRIHELSDEKVTLRLGMIDSIASLLLVRNDNLSLLNKVAHLSLIVDNSTRLSSYVAHNDVDMALTAQLRALSHTLSSTYLGDEPLVTVAHTQYAKQANLEIRHGKLPNFLSYNLHSQTHQLVDEHLAAKGVTTEPIFYSTSPEIMLQILLTHQATAVLPYMLVKPYIERGALQRIQTGRGGVIARPILCVQRTNSKLPAVAQNLIRELHLQLQNLQREASK